MSKLIELKQDRATLVEQMRELLDKADKEKRDLTDEETKQYSDWDKSVDELDKKIDREEKLDKLETREAEIKKVKKPFVAPAVIGKAENDEEFKSLGEFVHAVVTNRKDPRLEYHEFREQSMGTGAKGGFMVPPQFAATLLSVPVQQAILGGRCRVIPTEGDAPITIPTKDQSPGKGRLSGISVTWIDEAGDKPETDMYLKEITLTPHELAAHVVLTDKLIRNWPAAQTVIEDGLRGGLTNEIEKAIRSGSGAGQPKGFIGSQAEIAVIRDTTMIITSTDIYNMYNQFPHGLANGVWVANPKLGKSLITMKDDSSALMWHPNLREGEPNSLMGMPLVYDYRSPGAGSKGDLCLVDMDYYALCRGSGPYMAVSSHVYFLTNRTVVKCFVNIDGMPWLSTTIPLSDTAITTTAVVSPFVVLSNATV